jgi:O-antigen/teichoic acid export membrane protein
MSQSFSEEDIKKIAKGTGTTLIGSSIGKGLFFLSQVIIARLLGVEAFGLYALGFAAVKVCEIIARLGLNTGGMRFVSIYKDGNTAKLKGTLISAIGISLANGTLISLLLYFLSGFVAHKIFHKPELTETLQLFAFSIPFVAGMIVVHSLLQGSHTTKYTVYTRDFIQPITYIFLIVIFYYTDHGLQGMVYAFTLSYLIALITGLLFLRKLFPQILKIDIKPVYEFKNLFSYSAPLLFIGFLNYFLFWTDTLMLGFFSTTRDVGIYRAAFQVPFIMTFFLNAANSIYAPLAANLYHKDEMLRLSNIYRTTTRWVTYAAVPIFILILLAPKEIMTIFGKEFVGTGYIVLIIISFGQLINCIVGGAGYTLIMTGRQNIQLFISVASVFLTVVLNIILIPRYGSIGAAIANSVSISLENITKTALVLNYLKIYPFSKNLVKFFSFSTASVIVLLFLNRYLLSSAHYSFWIKSIELLTVFSIFFFLTGLEAEDRYLVQKIKSRLVV